MNTKEKKPIYKKVWFWVLAVIILGAIGAGMGGTKNQANETTKSTNDSTSQTQSEQKASKNKARLTLDDDKKDFFTTCHTAFSSSTIVVSFSFYSYIFVFRNESCENLYRWVTAIVVTDEPMWNIFTIFKKSFK